jgi:hypothetical protein
LKAIKIMWLFISLTPRSTARPTIMPMATFAATETRAPTAITCPKGTVLEPSVNRCFYATRTPKVEEPYCVQFSHKWACINHGCSWSDQTKNCS